MAKSTFLLSKLGDGHILIMTEYVLSETLRKRHNKKAQAKGTHRGIPNKTPSARYFHTLDFTQSISPTVPNITAISMITPSLLSLQKHN